MAKPLHIGACASFLVKVIFFLFIKVIIKNKTTHKVFFQDTLIILFINIVFGIAIFL